jgi:hypothetical protein
MHLQDYFTRARGPKFMVYFAIEEMLALVGSDRRDLQRA